MSPKKKSKRPGRPAAPGPGPAESGPPAARRTGPATAAASGVSRTPVVLDDRRRWPAAVWTALAAVWALGASVFFVLFLAEGFALISRDQGAGASMTAAAWYLLGLVVCALGAPVAGAVWAALLRRKIAAVLFSFALLVSAVALFSLDTPVGIAQAIGNGIASG
ncbi:hypothetical protein [Streptomonospora salina]|uniref:ABC-type sugar transport system permease subunit n=1 Tax=Streptomonospora salina TaxID=104205 RepID=A0A841E4Z5_9ACTN|nr:hypothetical protein [Streptomonospora salina]MBB5996278.1 ABC-type sugar transport system permease subunit [Streptomonospora salina]